LRLTTAPVRLANTDFLARQDAFFTHRHYMPELLRFAHLAFACIWLGCIVTQLIVERSLFAAGEDFRLRSSQLNWRIAVFVEVPAFVGVLVTGAYTLAMPHAVGLGFQVMLTAGVLTVFLSVFKVWLIYKRLSAARRNSWSTHEKLVYFQRSMGVLVLFGVFISIIAGAISRSGG
jgi:hypothetical protein